MTIDTKTEALTLLAECRGMLRDSRSVGIKDLRQDLNNLEAALDSEQYGEALRQTYLAAASVSFLLPPAPSKISHLLGQMLVPLARAHAKEILAQAEKRALELSAI